ncbi:AAA family ATPase [Luteolibacter flavescens]|uniref:AAA family ATPase n=1 Tax=Luteolibacter flavescens TaxID=1859460 RepID=A0ABT3FS20_9BACT|nr:AAA family ATPase [Luteolibacter flavescens]MCW1886373.1 AAA family ATPase [Luteolibacter flavescens]
MVHIQRLTILDVGRISNLSLELHPGVNLICGPNGIGKTTILECIGQAFSRAYSTILRKRVGSDTGSFEIVATTHEGPLALRNELKFFTPETTRWSEGAGPWEKSVLTLKTNRFFNYIGIDSLQRDPSDENRHRALGATGIEFTDIKNWFVNRLLFSAHENALTTEQIANLELSKAAFSALDPTVTFSRILPASFDILLNTSNGEIYFEYLSSGFKSCLCLILGLIKEIEYRFNSPYIPASDFSGIVVIDELDLHLHPDWQAKLVPLLRTTFPHVQFVAATHSPHMIQEALPHEVIALTANEEGVVSRRELAYGDSGFQGWTIEEILTDIMGMSDTRSEKYHQLEREFEHAIAENNRDAAERIFSNLDSFLHPTNVQRKLFRLQFGRLED